MHDSRIKHIIIFFGFIIFTLQVNSQKIGESTFKVHGTLKVKKGEIDETTTIRLYNKGKVVKSLVSKSSFKFSLKLNTDYTIEFSKEGYVSKSVEVVTYVPKNASKSSYRSFEFNVKLFKKIDGLDFYIFKQPIAVIDYNVMSSKMTYDKEYTLGVKKQMANAQKVLYLASLDQELDSVSISKLITLKEEEDLDQWRMSMINEKRLEIEALNTTEHSEDKKSK